MIRVCVKMVAGSGHYSFYCCFHSSLECSFLRFCPCRSQPVINSWGTEGAALIELFTVNFAQGCKSVEELILVAFISLLLSFMALRICWADFPKANISNRDGSVSTHFKAG
jgi:hypothetical protein